MAFTSIFLPKIPSAIKFPIAKCWSLGKYLPTNAKGFSSVNWGKQLKGIFHEFCDTTFYWVDATEEGKTLADVFHLKNIIHIGKDKLCEELKIT